MSIRLSAKMDRTDSGTPWGFRMTGGKDFGAPLVVQRVNPGSLAAKCGLQEGDTIVRIGSTPADGLRHKDAQQMIIDAGNSLELALERSSYGGHAPQTDNYGYSSPAQPAYGGPQPSYNSAPRPYDGHGGSLISQTANLNLGSPQPDVSSLNTQKPAAPSAGTKPSIGVKPVLPPGGRGKEITVKSVKTDTPACQTDAGKDDTMVEVHVERKTIVIPSRSQPKPSADTELGDDGVKKYFPSETFRLVQEQESGVSQSQFNPLTGAEIKTNQSRTLMMLDRALTGDEVIDVPIVRKTVVIPSAKTHPPPVSEAINKDEVIGAPSERKTIVIPSSKTQSRSSPAHAPAPAAAPTGGRPGAWQPQIPTGPRKMRVGKVGEAKSLPAVGGGVRIPVCNSCNIAIRGPFVSALDKTWCPDHFICANPQCRTPLINCGFVEEAGQLFCERDYEQYFAPRCGKCGRAIVGTIVSAMEQKFHVECFTCVHCHGPLLNGLFHLEKGEPYCDKDWAAMFQTKCYGCQFPIEPGDRWVEALNQNWHSECFNCSTCQVNLEGQSFFAKGGKPYCKKHSAGGRF